MLVPVHYERAPCAVGTEGTTPILWVVRLGFCKMRRNCVLGMDITHKCKSLKEINLHLDKFDRVSNYLLSFEGEVEIRPWGRMLRSLCILVCPNLFRPM
jgi:hypothetical protein